MQNDHSPNNSDISAQLEALQKAYASELHNKVEEIRGYWKTLKEQGWDRTLATEMYRKTHNLAGSGTSFGFPAVSQCARELEMELRIINEQGALPDSDIQSLIELRLQKLCNSTAAP